MEKSKVFGALRSVFLPVHRFELKKVVSLFFLLFLICVSYDVLRNLKDVVILTAKHSGAEVIPFIKVWGTFPAAIGATWLYIRLNRYFDKTAVFYIIISSFLIYFFVFAFFLYPNSEKLHLHALGNWLSTILPEGFHGLIALVRNWVFTSFYIVSELWATLILGVLYWGFVNDVTDVGEAKRTYGILNIGSNIAPILGGLLGLIFSKPFAISFLPTNEYPWSQTIYQLILLVIVLGIACMGLYAWINRYVLTSKEEKDTCLIKQEVKKHLSIRESIKYILRSRYLVPLAIIFLGYNISINLTDVLWKAQLKSLFKDPNLMLEHMNKITMGIGVLATFGALFFSVLITRLGWTFTAVITPVIMTFVAVGFFTFMFCADSLAAFSATVFGLAPFTMVAYCGSLQNCLSKACKYSVFDASKEIAFLPLNSESKIKGKAAIDGLGSSLGKSGSSLAYQVFIILMGSISLSAPFVAVILFVILIAWVISTFYLGKQFKEMTTVEKPIIVQSLSGSNL
ncbi:Npt1/Npt2 family nucleotide transporter [Candidatus Rhabdochlamydia sp. T3358]|uniref:Npt1/Npt2 family nucleotide transporter n=1 Tax=Candidatus Rhabdochlamydia sp. T3358 TaxID=2099795 RepID=UPI0010B7E06D|nr:Npt1/Npt2 family nucleotide transporter [Candidatus Rhabdochlamydia sp. T3358]VHO03494.1 ADP,ATP carrier protein 1 [Candidatus Rhabdochlamydia sp. T3358]